MSKVGVCTLRDGRVHVVHPTQWAVDTCKTGGNTYLCIRGRQGLWLWLRERCSPEQLADYARLDMMPIDLAIEWEAWKFTSDPNWRPDRPEADRQRLARAWCMAKTFGGLEESEAIDLIVAKDATPWSSVEIMDQSELPARQWRNAWRRSSNGGPIWIDDKAAEAIMWENFDAART